MRKLSFGVLALLFVSACQDSPEAPRLSPRATVSAAAVSPPGGRPIMDEYIVVFHDNVSDPGAEARQLAAANGATIRFVYASAIKGFAAHMSSATAAALARNPNVDYVEQDQTIALDATETMDAAGDPWGLDRIDAHSGLDNSYTYALTGAGVTAYIIDTGILTTHSEFGGRATGGFTAISDGGGTTDCNGHGTHVSGTVGGATYGVAKNVQLVAVRVLDCGGSGSTSGVIAGVNWVTASHASPAVANMSLGGGASSALDQAVANSIASGVAYAIAAGNGDFLGRQQDACNSSPARVATAMTIGATTKTDAKTSWSNYGNCVDWFAPGNGIKSSWIGASNTATNTISGTSMATPHTTGVAALYLQSNPGATAQQVRDALFNATTKGVVTSSSTTNNHLLYTPPGGFGAPPPNSPPVAAFTSNCTNLACTFTDQSTDPDGNATITSRAWDYGDGVTGTTSSHTYSTGGTYTVTLTVTDNASATNSVAHAVTVNTAPPSAATLTVTNVNKVKSNWTATLNWSGFSGVASVIIYRNNASIGSPQPASGSYTDGGKGGGTFTYKVCDINDANNCTNSVTVSP
jgi:PKD repeat protein